MENPVFYWIPLTSTNTTVRRSSPLAHSRGVWVGWATARGRRRSSRRTVSTRNPVGCGCVTRRERWRGSIGGARARERAGRRRRRWSRGRKRVGSGCEDMAETIVSWGWGGGPRVWGLCGKRSSPPFSRARKGRGGSELRRCALWVCGPAWSLPSPQPFALSLTPLPLSLPQPSVGGACPLSLSYLHTNSRKEVIFVTPLEGRGLSGPQSHFIFLSLADRETRIWETRLFVSRPPIPIEMSLSRPTFTNVRNVAIAKKDRGHSLHLRLVK